MNRISVKGVGTYYKDEKSYLIKKQNSVMVK